MPENTRELILKTLQEKALLKLEVCNKTEAGFRELKKTLSQIQEELKSSLRQVISKNTSISFIDRGEFEAEFHLVDDSLLFMKHSNVFTFENSHEIWKSSYVQDDHSRSYCGKIYVYNFLSDSFKYNRTNDVGYLIARIFINKQNHFFVEGKRQMGFLYNNFANDVFDVASIRKVVESILLYSLDFDPYAPPYEELQQLTVQEILNTSVKSRLTTGKRLGFRFQVDKGDAF